MSINPAKAIRDAVVSTLQTLVDGYFSALPDGTVLVRDGWPDAMAGIPSGSYIVITSGSASSEPHVPVPYSSTTAAGVVTQLYDIANLNLNVQVDVFADYRDQRDALVPIVRGAFCTLPLAGSAELTLSGYHNAQATVKVTGESDDDPAGPIPGRWRHTFEVAARVDVLVSHDWYALNRLDLSLNGDILTLESA